VYNLDPHKDVRQVSQELRIASPVKQPLEYVAGLFYADANNDKDANVTIEPNPSCPRRRCRARSSPTTCSTRGWTTKALFGQATWHLTDATGIIAGLRYTRDTVASTSRRPAW
jgi:iron complex outermembrane receptor protein